MSAYTKPIVVNSSGKTTPLERISLGGSSDGQFSEKWLQNNLYENPNCLPVREIDPHIGTLVPVCTEIETGAGPADILYVTTTGQIVLVETKLWRNPEARREVVAQILDYAKQLTEWSFEDLARQSAIASGQGPDYLLSRLRQFASNADEAAFVDGVNLSLKSGDFLLIVVGDGIRSGAESLIGFIERYGNLRFRFGLIEVAAFRLSTNEILLQPRILAKTEILQRTVLIGPSGPVEIEDIARAEDTELRTNADANWFQSFWSDYLSVLSLSDATQALPSNSPKGTNLFLSLPPSGAKAWISAYIAKSAGKGGVYLTFLKAFDKVNEFYERLLAEKQEIEEIVGVQLSWVKEGNKVYITVPSIQFGDLNAQEERQRVIKYLTDYTNRMVNAFRPRLKILSKELV